MKFLSPEVTLYLYKSTIRPAWNTFVMLGLLLLVATWNCQISYKNEYAGLFVLSYLPLLNPGLILEMQPVQVFSKGINLVDVHLNWFHFLTLEGGLHFLLMECMVFLSILPDVTRMSMSTVSFLAQLDSGILCLQNAFL